MALLCDCILRPQYYIFTIFLLLLSCFRQLPMYLHRCLQIPVLFSAFTNLHFQRDAVLNVRIRGCKYYSSPTFFHSFSIFTKTNNTFFRTNNLSEKLCFFPNLDARIAVLLMNHIRYRQYYSYPPLTESCSLFLWLSESMQN